ncbi:hypothetical protein [Methanobacterium formicicum]|uniref:Uncharacterized protein n=1 Tax=Methanobacterium formicicum (strain DSM 3637 / PP1) TaxID=1204725 RepID=K2QDL7_METFP|nr:hypothetical protein [Methanobacterium formicicum]EKF86136.1 hypothetical protein A994_04250 [Methanobacterium formicicum DSM 3637]
MNINKLFMVVILVVLCISLSSSWAVDDITKDQQTWVSEQNSEVKFTYLESTITVTIKNNNDHVEYFKISQKYTGTLDTTSGSPIYWKVVWTDPCALKMIKYMSDVDEDDLGWKIQPGETKTVSFKVTATNFGEVNPNSYIRQPGANNTFWPLLNEPGLQASWFLPNEIEYLNPSLDLISWKGHFCFWIKNTDTTRPKVSGIVRAPIVPIDSSLTYSNPQVTYTDKEVPWANTAAWDVLLYPGQSKHYSYTYQWPATSSSSTSKGSSAAAASSIPTTAAAATNTTVPTSQTGVPFGLFLVGVIIIGAGVAYAKFFR